MIILIHTIAFAVVRASKRSFDFELTKMPAILKGLAEEHEKGKLYENPEKDLILV